MSKFLVNTLGWVPYVGTALKIGYVSQRALEVVNGVKLDNNSAELKGQELEDHIKDLSQQAYDEHLKSEVDNLGLPGFATNKASEKAIDIISKKLSEKYAQKVV